MASDPRRDDSNPNVDRDRIVFGGAPSDGRRSRVPRPEGAREDLLRVFTAGFSLLVIYRIILWSSSTDGASRLAEGRSIQYLLGASARDAVVAAVLATLLGSALIAARRWGGPRWRYASRALVVATQAWVATMCIVHRHTLIILGVGFDPAMIGEVSATMSPAELVSYASWTDIWVALGALLLWPALGCLPESWRRARDGTMLVATGTMVVAQIGAHPPPRPPDEAIQCNPVEYFATALWKDVSADSSDDAFYAGDPAVLPGRISSAVQPARSLGSPPAEKPVEPTGEIIRPNVLFIVMESVGTRYVFDSSRGHPAPMPFLKRLSEEGVYLSSHYSTSNSSPRALFSIFSGLYPPLHKSIWAVEPDVDVSSAVSFLSPDYESYLITPGRLNSYFPRGFLENSGLHELHGMENIALEDPRPSPPRALNELDVADFFEKRLARTREPFFAVYYSYAPHFDYFDHGEEFRITGDTTTSLNRYFNNLSLLDRIVEGFVTQLEVRDLLDRTIVVLVGDHGEAFDQHPGNRGHARHSYDENLRTPCVLYNPRVFPSHRIERVTSHVDILPTLLDAMHVPYDPDLFQGDSIFAPPRRRFVFGIGNENTLTSVSDRRIKLQVSLADRACWVFDLLRDPDEQAPLACTRYGQQLDSTMTFRRNHNFLLRAHP